MMFGRNPLLPRSKLSNQVRKDIRKYEVTRKVPEIRAAHQAFVLDAEIFLNNLGIRVNPLRNIEAGQIIWAKAVHKAHAIARQTAK